MSITDDDISVRAAVELGVICMRRRLTVEYCDGDCIVCKRGVKIEWNGVGLTACPICGSPVKVRGAQVVGGWYGSQSVQYTCGTASNMCTMYGYADNVHHVTSVAIGDDCIQEEDVI